MFNKEVFTSTSFLNPLSLFPAQYPPHLHPSHMHKGEGGFLTLKKKS